MTWNTRIDEANWIHLGYIAANSASVLVPISKGRRVELSKSDNSQLLQTVAFFDAASDGLSSFEEPSLLFHTRDAAFSRPAGALKIAVSTYAAVHGGPVSNPDRFSADLVAYKSVLVNILEGSDPPGDAVNKVVVFLEALIDRARSELHASSRHADA